MPCADAFAFVPLMPERQVVSTYYQDDNLRARAEAMFDEVEALFKGEQSVLTSDYNRNDVQPGHSYFLAKI